MPQVIPKFHNLWLIFKRCRQWTNSPMPATSLKTIILVCLCYVMLCYLLKSKNIASATCLSVYTVAHPHNWNTCSPASSQIIWKAYNASTSVQHTEFVNNLECSLKISAYHDIHKHLQNVVMIIIGFFVIRLGFQAQRWNVLTCISVQQSVDTHNAC